MEKKSRFIQVLDISHDGMDFVLNDGNISIGDVVEVILDFDALELGAETSTVQKGQVLTQLLLRSGRSNGVDHAMQRFSIQFQSELDVRILQNVRAIRLATSA